MKQNPFIQPPRHIYTILIYLGYNFRFPCRALRVNSWALIIKFAPENLRIQVHPFPLVHPCLRGRRHPVDISLRPWTLERHDRRRQGRARHPYLHRSYDNVLNPAALLGRSLTWSPPQRCQDTVELVIAS